MRHPRRAEQSALTRSNGDSPFELPVAPRRVRARFLKSMSQHRSLKGASTIAAKRNVLKRFERVELLKKRGQWKDGAKVVGLPKTKPDA